MFRIAICDDEAYFRNQEKKLIEQYMRDQGYTCQIDLYASGKELLSRTDGDLPYDMIFLDISMEEMDGLQTAERIRRLHKVFFYVMEDGVKAYSRYDRLDEVEKKLRQYGFSRVHQSFLVNMKHAKGVERYRVTMENGTEVSVSKKYYKDVEKEYIKRQGEI